VTIKVKLPPLGVPQEGGIVGRSKKSNSAYLGLTAGESAASSE